MQVSSKVKGQCDFCSQATAAGQQEGGGDWNTASINPGHLDIAGAVAAAICSGKYLQCNLKMDKDANLPHVMKALVQIRQGQYADEWGWSYADGIQDYRRATLILFGLKGHGTHGHVDWSEANNIAFSFKQVGFAI